MQLSQTKNMKATGRILKKEYKFKNSPFCLESFVLILKKGIPLTQLSPVFYVVRSRKNVLSVFTKVIVIKYYYRAIRSEPQVGPGGSR